MLIVKFKFKNYIKFINIIKLIITGIFVLFNIYLLQSCATTDFCGGDPNLNPNTDCKPGVPKNLRFEVSSNTIYTIFWDVTDGLRAFNSENLCYSSGLELSADSLVWTQEGAPKGGSYTQKDWNDTFATVEYNPNTKCNFRVSSCGSLGCSLPSNILEFYMGAPAPLDFKIINLSSQNEKVIHEVNESKTVTLIEKSFSFVWKAIEDLSYAIQFTSKFDDKGAPIWAANSYTQQVNSIAESTLKYDDTNLITSGFCLDSPGFDCEFSNTSNQNFGETYAYRIRTCLSSGERCGPYSDYIKVIIKAPALTNYWITITNSWISVSSISKIDEADYVLSWQTVEGLSSLLKYYIKECNAKDICNYDSLKEGTTLNYKSFSKISKEVVDAGNVFKYSVMICSNPPKFALETCGKSTEVITKNLAFGKLSLELVGSPFVDNENNVYYSISWATNNLVGYNFILQWSTSNSENDSDWQTAYKGKNNTADTKSIGLMPKLKTSFYYRFKACKAESSCSGYSDVLKVYVPPIIANPDQLITINPYKVRLSSFGSRDGNYEVIISKITGLEDSNYILEESKIIWLSNNSETVWSTVWDSKSNLWASNSIYNPKKVNNLTYYEKLLNANNVNIDNSDTFFIKYRVKLCKDGVCDLVKDKDNQDLEQYVYMFPTILPFYEASVGKNSEVIIDLYDVSTSNNVLDDKDNGKISSFIRYDLVWFTSEKSVTDIADKQTNFIKTPNYSNMLTWYSAGFENGPKCLVDNSENFINSNNNCSTNSPNITKLGDKYNFSFSKFYKEKPQYFGYAIRSCVGVVCSNWANSKVVSFELPVPTFSSDTWQINNNTPINWSSTHYVTLTTNSTSGSISWTSYSDTSLSLKFEKYDKVTKVSQTLTNSFYLNVTVNPASDIDYKVRVCGNKSSAQNDKVCGAWSILNIKGEYPKNINLKISLTGTNLKTISGTSYSSSDGSFKIQWESVPFSNLYNILWATNTASEANWITIAGLTGLFNNFDLLKGKVTYNYKVQSCATIDNCSNWSQAISVNVLLNSPIFIETIQLQNLANNGTTSFKWATATTGNATIPEVVILDTKWGTGKGVNFTFSWQSVGNAASYQVCQLVNGKTVDGNTIGSINIKNINDLCKKEIDLKSYTSTTFYSTLKEAGSTYSYFIRSCNDAKLQDNTTCGDWSEYPLTIVVPFATPKVKADEEVCINTLGEKVICKDGDNIYVTFDNSYNIWGSLSGYEYPLSYQLGQISSRGNYTWESVSLPIELSNKLSADFELTSTNSNTVKYALRACSITNEYNLSLKKNVDNRACSNFKEFSVVFAKLGSGTITLEKNTKIINSTFNLNTNSQETEWCRPDCFSQLATLKYSSVIGAKYYQISYCDAGEDNEYNIINGDDCGVTWQTLSKTFSGVNFEIDKNTFYTPNHYIYFKIKNCVDKDCTYTSDFSKVYGIYYDRYTLADRDGNGLIEIYDLDDLNKVSYNLSGTSWKTSESDTGTGINYGCPLTGCRGYELITTLDFNIVGSDDSINKWSSIYGADGWVPIGNCGADNDCSTTNDNKPFVATLNGNGYEIKNLYINSTAINRGLFGYVSKKSTTIQNLSITNAQIISTNDNVGALIGVNDGGIISNIKVTGNICGNNYVGGLVGLQLSGTTVNSYFTNSSDRNIKESAVKGNSNVGGLVGAGTGNFVNNFVIGNIIGKNTNIGGLIGQNAGIVTNSYSAGSVTGGENVGGLVGLIHSSIQGFVNCTSANCPPTDLAINNSYSTSIAWGTNNVGGLVGSINSKKIDNSFATGVVMGKNTGGLIGKNANNNYTNITNSYWDSISSVQILSSGGKGKATREFYKLADINGCNGSACFTLVSMSLAWVSVSNSYPVIKYTCNDGYGNLLTNLPPEIQNNCITAFADSRQEIPGQPKTILRIKSINPDIYKTNNNIPNKEIFSFVWDVVSNFTRYFIRWLDLRTLPNSDTPNWVVDTSWYTTNSATLSVADLNISIIPDTFNFHLFQIKSCTQTNDCSNWSAGYNLYNRVDKDGNGLIEIYTIEDLNNIRYNLAGTSLKISVSDPGNSVGCPSNGCIGYELKNDLDFNTTRWSSNYIGVDKVADGWVPIGDDTISYSASFNGNGFQVKNLYIKSNNSKYAGLFGKVNSNKSISNIGVTNFWISISSSSNSYSGGLVGYMSVGGITNSYATGFSYAYSASSASYSGGLVGFMNGGLISKSWAFGSATSSSSSTTSINRSGGLVGEVRGGGGISNSYATGSSFSTGIFNPCSGGLVGSIYQEGWISNSYATGNSTSDAPNSNNSCSGGLVGAMDGTAWVSNSYATGWSSAIANSSTNNSFAFSGGLVSYKDGTGGIFNSYATGSSTASNAFKSYSGGLVGFMYRGSISNSYATGSSSISSSLNNSNSYSGGLVGYMEGGGVLNSWATGTSYSASNGISRSGGLIGSVTTVGWVSNSYATGSSSAIGNDLSYSGGLVGEKLGTGGISNSYATGWSTASASSATYSGGLVGYMSGSGNITNSYATGWSTSSSNYDAFSGGLVGYMNGTGGISNSYATGFSNASSSYANAFSGGLVGKMDGGKYLKQLCNRFKLY